MRDHKPPKQDVWVVVPCYNEASTIGQVILEIRRFVPTVVVVDDASTDQTASRLANLPVTVTTNPKNLGYVQSIQLGLQYAFSHGARYAITFDADGQHLAQDLPKYLDIIAKHHPDLIFGKRSFQNRLIEKLFSVYTKKRFGISDPFCGFKAYRKIWFKQIGSKLEHHYTIGLESIFVELEQGSPKVIEVDLTTARRKDRPRFAGHLGGNLLELRAAINLIWHSRVSR